MLGHEKFAILADQRHTHSEAPEKFSRMRESASKHVSIIRRTSV